LADTNILNDIPFQPDFEGLCKRLHVRAGSADAVELRAMLNQAIVIARPLAVFRSAMVENREEDTVTLSGVQFHSQVLRINLANATKVYPFVATCGSALQEWGNQQTDIIYGYWAEAIKEEALRASLTALFQCIEQYEKLSHFSTMSPGSLESWPISQQSALFTLLGDAANQSGVKLTDSMLMIPTKSVSGIIFETDATFESCQLCQRDNCPNRRAPYDETLYEREYCPAVG
jgi:hypothetical protein